MVVMAVLLGIEMISNTIARGYLDLAVSPHW